MTLLTLLKDAAGSGYKSIEPAIKQCSTGRVEIGPTCWNMRSYGYHSVT